MTSALLEGRKENGVEITAVKDGRDGYPCFRARSLAGVLVFHSLHRQHIYIVSLSFFSLCVTYICMHQRIEIISK